MSLSYKTQLEELFKSQTVLREKLTPVQWAEQKRYLTSDETAMPGKFDWSNSPHAKEIAMTASPYHPAKKIAIMKGSQAGMTKAVIENIIGYWIEQDPGNILYLTGHSDLSKESMENLDVMFQNSGIDHLIRSNTMRSTKSGNTDMQKQFPGGWLKSGSASNHKLLRQRSAGKIIADDIEVAGRASKHAGDTQTMIESRSKSFYDRMKIYYISSPELKQTSVIEPIYLRGDQRKYQIPCQCCGTYIELVWEIAIDEKEKAGIYYKLDKTGKVVEGSVGYICQECGGFFDDVNKYEFLNEGLWKPTAESQEKDLISFHISGLYAMPGQYSWEYYVNDYLKANPVNGEFNEEKHKAFVNNVLGLTYELKGEAPKASMLMTNIRNYEIASVPEKMSLKHGNGKIVMITCASDMNGVKDDARLDYEIVAWTESGSSYSIDHGSVGTFVPRENSLKEKEDRVKWSYDPTAQNCVWPEFEKVISQKFESDTGRKLNIIMTGLDYGHLKEYAFWFLDNTNKNVVGLRGEKDSKFINDGIDVKKFRPAKERSGCYLLQSNLLKDELAWDMALKWNKAMNQPPGMMNFPQPANGKYIYNDFFAHFESEERKVKTDKGVTSYLWEKKNSTVQNHLWDCRYYNIALRYIVTSIFCEEAKVKNGVWDDFVDIYCKICKIERVL